MNASDWMYIGEGGKHAVFGYRGDEKKWKGRVLRIQKDVLTAAAHSNSPNNYNSRTCNTDPLYYIRDVIKPLLGHYVDVPIVLELKWEFLESLRKQTVSEGVVPTSRLDQWNSKLNSGPSRTIPAPHAHLLQNYRNAEENVLSITFEIKPKAGYKAFSPLVDPANRIKFSKTRFEILQQLHCSGLISKGWDRNINPSVVPSSYCPMDLFSQDAIDVKRSIGNLLATPQNNLRVWLDDTMLLGDDTKKIDDLLYVRALELLSSPNESPPGVDSGREAFYNEVSIVVSTVLLREELLDKLLRLQRLDVVDADGAILVYERLMELCGDQADEVLDSPSPLTNMDRQQDCVLHESPFRKPLDCPALDCLLREIDNFASRLYSAEQLSVADMDESFERCKRLVGSLSREACVFLLKNWLLSLAMCDVSFFLKLRPTTLSEDSNEFSIGTEEARKSASDKDARVVRCQDESLPGVLVANGRAFVYNLKIIDCDRKPAKKLKTRGEKESAIRFYKDG